MTAGDVSSAQAREALEQLCRIYWYPLYAYARSRGDGSHEAEDLVQGFFSEVIEKNLVARADREKGRFRSFLLGSFQNHRSKAAEHRDAAKRGGGAEFVPLEELRAEERYAAVLRSDEPAEHRFDREWAVTMLDEALKRLAAEYDAAGKKDAFLQLRGLLHARADQAAYARLAVQTGRTEAALRMEVSRLRARYASRLREVVAETVADASEVDGELRYLLALLAS